MNSTTPIRRLQTAALLLLLLLLTVAAAHGHQEPQFWTKATVRVNNTLDGGVDLKLHCKSKDDDLGVKVLGHHQTYEFKFNPSFSFRTQFYCSFEWRNGGGVRWFDIYIQKRDWLYCEVCEWSVHQSGPCRRSPAPAGGGFKCFGWNK